MKRSLILILISFFFLTVNAERLEGAAAGGGASASVELTSANFDQMVVQSKDLWLIDFYATWCPPCKALAPEWAKAANNLQGKGPIKLGQVNCDNEKDLKAKYAVSFYPTVMFLGADKTTGEECWEREAPDIEAYAMEKLQEAKLTSQQVKAERLLEGEEQTANIELTDANFDELVTNSKDFWLVDFFAPWCPPCKVLLPEWKKAANVLEGKVKMGTVNCVDQQVAKTKYPLRGYPTVYMLGEDKTKPVVFRSRDVAGIEIEALALMKTLNSPVEVTELTSQEVFTAKCARACYVSFLAEEGRAQNLDTLVKVAQNHRAYHSFSFLWAAAGKQPELEKYVGVGTSFPTFVALNMEHNIYGVYKGAWEVDAINGYVNAPEGDVKATTGVPTIVTVPPSHPKYEL